MVVNFMEQQKLLEDKATKLLKEYEGNDLEELGKHLDDKSSYYHNYYMLPNGLEVLEVFDKKILKNARGIQRFHEIGDIFGVIDGQEVLIGYSDIDNIIHLGVLS